MLTDFGRFLRKLRIDCGELIKDMSQKLNVTASYLSAVETGKRKIPDIWVNEIARLYRLDSTSKAALANAAARSARMVKFNLENFPDYKRETAILFAREFDRMDDETVLQIRDLLRERLKGE
jgi:transcriptional regulator with XRE-family HTH domain